MQGNTKKKKPRLLLHSCCGPCSSTVILRLRENYDVTVLYYNPNIYPEEEYFDNQEYFDDLIYKYNKNKPKNHQIAFVNLRKTEFIKNSNKKIIRSKALEENN